MQAVHVHADVDDAAEGARDALQELLRTLEALATEAGVVTGLVESVSKAMYRLEERTVVTLLGSSPQPQVGGAKAVLALCGGRLLLKTSCGNSPLACSCGSDRSKAMRECQ